MHSSNDIIYMVDVTFFHSLEKLVPSFEERTSQPGISDHVIMLGFYFSTLCRVTTMAFIQDAFQCDPALENPKIEEMYIKGDIIFIHIMCVNCVMDRRSGLV